MRLVDVEPLDFISFQATGDTAYDQGFEDGVRFVAEKLDASPTIDAIPVEWLEEHRDKRRVAAAAHSRIGSMAVLESINVVLELWKKEQEAQDE